MHIYEILPGEPQQKKIVGQDDEYLWPVPLFVNAEEEEDVCIHRACTGLCPGQLEVQVKCAGYQCVSENIPPVSSQTGGDKSEVKAQS